MELRLFVYFRLFSSFQCLLSSFVACSRFFIHIDYTDTCNIGCFACVRICMCNRMDSFTKIPCTIHISVLFSLTIYIYRERGGHKLLCCELSNFGFCSLTLYICFSLSSTSITFCLNLMFFHVLVINLSMRVGYIFR